MNNFDPQKPNRSQTIGAVIDSAAENDRALFDKIQAHADDRGDPHGIQALKDSKADYEAHKANATDAHGIGVTNANVAALQAETAAARGSALSVAKRLETSLNQDGTIKLSSIASKWIDPSLSPTYVSPTSFSVPGDQTLMLIPGAQLRFSIAGNYAFAPIASRSFGGGVTTVTLDPSYPVLTAGVTQFVIALVAFDNNLAQALAAEQAARMLMAARLNSVAYEVLHANYEGLIPANTVVRRFLACRSFSLPVGLAGSVAKAGVAATAAAQFTIQKNGVAVATVSFAAGATVPVLDCQSVVTVYSDDEIAIAGPAVADATLAKVMITLKGTLA